ncbi:MAG: hypothetical protein FJY82_02280 [Candidatus Aminicenantes bacterium]|nr:hypothetical protein [Candidatus Aminicenantes bacterium]
MTLREALRGTRHIFVPGDGHPVEATVAAELAAALDQAVAVRRAGSRGTRNARNVFLVAAAEPPSRLPAAFGLRPPAGKEWVALHVESDGSGVLLSSRPSFLYAAFTAMAEELMDVDISRLRPWVRAMSFAVEKSTFDLVLTQYARTIRPFDREKYVREYARLGFTHVEVNALAGPFPAEPGVPGEFYPDFYTYAPALDQFVDSRFNRGLYPREYLQANLDRLKANAGLALKYGLAPGLLCFEPRSMPEAFFQKFPTLRGPRVDHPFRSFKPRYALTLAHPAARAHYAELVANLLREVPWLEFLDVWSNDSGSGFEHTKSLYVGRNGGPYLIREWKDDDEIARVAAENIARFLRLLREAGAALNPRFRVITRLESFYGERRHLWPLLGNGVDVEANSLLTSGWELNYAHPVYKDVRVLNAAVHNTLSPKEKAAARELAARGGRSYFYHFFASHANHEPLLGIPFPWLTWEKLAASARLGLENLAHMGGLHPPDKVPCAVNQEVFRAFQFDARLDIDDTVSGIARNYVGAGRAAALVRVWRLAERAIRHFVPMSLYSGFGTVWNRLLVRPLVPDIERIPEEERTYYENIMVSPVHNPNKVDLGKDVLFELITKDYARKAFRRIDRRVWGPLGSAIALAERERDRAAGRGEEKPAGVFADQAARLRALRGLYETLRNAGVWIYAVREFQETKSPRRRAECRALLREMAEREIRNAREMIRLWHEAPLEWMMVSDFGETPFIHGRNFPALLEKKIALMERHRNDRPRIDPDYMFRLDG